MSPAPTFELLDFEATPVSATVAVVELSGSFAGLSPTRPRLLVETGGVAREMPALSSDGDPWRASFAVPLSSLHEEARFALVPGRGPLIELPAPSVGEGDADRFVAVARSANRLRQRVAELESVAETLAAELDEVRTALSAAEARVVESHDAALLAREEQARAEGEADETRAAIARAQEESAAELAALRTSHEEELAEVRGAHEAELAALRATLEEAEAEIAEVGDRAAAAEAEARAAQADLAFAQDRVESLMRESREARTTVAAMRSGGAPGAPASLDDDASDPLDAPGPAAPDAPAPSGVDEGEGSDEIRASRSSASPDSAPSGDAADPRDAATVPLTEWAGGSDDPPADEAPLDEAPTVDAPTEETPSPGLWNDDEDSTRILRPRTSAGRRRPTAVSEDEDEDSLALEPVGDEVSPARRALSVVSSPRVIVGGIFLLLIIALVLIFSGIGLV